MGCVTSHARRRHLTEPPGAVIRRWLLWLLLALTLTGCAQLVPQTIALRGDWPSDVPRAIELRDVPFFPQTAYQCGPAALAITMNAAGAQVLPDALVEQVYLPARQGSLQIEMLAAPRRHSLVSWQIPPDFSALLRELAAGHPVLVLQDLGLWPLTRWHYAVVVGFDYAAGELYLRSGENQRQAMPFTVFELTWRRNGYWAMVVTPPGVVPSTATEAGYLTALLAFDRNARPGAARTAWEGFAARWPGNALASLALGNRLYAARDLPGAESVLRAAARSHPTSTEILNNLAQVLSEQGRNDDALAVIDRAAALPAGPFAGEVAATRSDIVRRLAR
jgi:hypothetical protein